MVNEFLEIKQKDEELVEELAKLLFDDDRTWNNMASATREYWRNKASKAIRAGWLKK
jgi:hypothetical protein